MVLDEHGGLFTFGSGAGGALGHGDTLGQEFPVKIIEFGKMKYTDILSSTAFKFRILNSNNFLPCFFKKTTMSVSIK